MNQPCCGAAARIGWFRWSVFIHFKDGDTLTREFFTRRGVNKFLKSLAPGQQIELKETRSL